MSHASRLRRFFLLSTIIAMLAACGGEDGNGTQTTSTTPPPSGNDTSNASNAAPIIGGVPPTQAVVGSTYTFTPTAGDPDGDALTFTISGQPSWATFDNTTGQLHGVPSSAGNFPNIVIGVTDGQASTVLAAFTITVQATSAGNTAPTISGAPAASVLVGSAYSFTPSANDADGDTLTFSVSGLPSWATFSSSSGRLRGTPSAADVGTFANIMIGVSDGRANAMLGPFTIDVVPVATGSATLSWTPPTQNDDGSPLTDLAGYRIYWGTAQGVYTNSAALTNPGITTYVVDQLTPATWYFVTTAVNSSGSESSYSNVGSKTIP